MGGGKKNNIGRKRGNVIRFEVLKLWERDEKCVTQLDISEDLSCLVLRQTRKILIN
jgi:hypothetical protein